MLIAKTSTEAGYWLVNPDGSVYARGDAQYKGGINWSNWPATPVVNSLVPGDSATDIAGFDNDGYIITTAKGGIYCFNAPYLGGT